MWMFGLVFESHILARNVQIQLLIPWPRAHILTYEKSLTHRRPGHLIDLRDEQGSRMRQRLISLTTLVYVTGFMRTRLFDWVTHLRQLRDSA